MLCFVWVQSFSFSHGGTWWCHTLWQVSAICLDCFSTWQIWGFLFPIQPPTQSLSRKFVMHVQCMKEREREREKALVKGIFWKTKKFSPFLWAKERTSFLTRKSKENVKTPIPVMDGKAQAITDNIPDTVHIDDIVKMHTNAHKH